MVQTKGPYEDRYISHNQINCDIVPYVKSQSLIMLYITALICENQLNDTDNSVNLWKPTKWYYIIIL